MSDTNFNGSISYFINETDAGAVICPGASPEASWDKCHEYARGLKEALQAEYPNAYVEVNVYRPPQGQIRTVTATAGTSDSNLAQIEADSFLLAEEILSDYI